MVWLAYVVLDLKKNLYTQTVAQVFGTQNCSPKGKLWNLKNHNYLLNNLLFDSEI